MGTQSAANLPTIERNRVHPHLSFGWSLLCPPLAHGEWNIGSSRSLEHRGTGKGAKHRHCRQSILYSWNATTATSNEITCFAFGAVLSLTTLSSLCCPTSPSSLAHNQLCIDPSHKRRIDYCHTTFTVCSMGIEDRNIDNNRLSAFVRRANQLLMYS
jgi:hypothetical protein